MTKIKLFWLIIIVDQMLKRRGFKYVCDYLKQYKQTIRPTKKEYSDEELIQICASIQTASKKHFLRNRAFCLHQSAIGFYLLLKKGAEVEFCVGAATETFAAHAWLERNNIVLNDKQSIKDSYQLLFKF